MSRFTGRDIAVSAVFLVVGGTVALLALVGLTGWSVAVLGILVSLIGVLVRLQFASHRSEISRQAKANGATRRAVKLGADATRSLATDLSTTRSELSALRTEVASMNADVAIVRASVAVSTLTNSEAPPYEQEARSVAVPKRTEPKKAIGLVGFFGHGNYGDELFIDVFQQFLSARFDLRIIPDLERKPYFSRPVEDKVAEVDALVMGGGDLVQQWSTDPRYFNPTYLQKPFYVAGVGVPIYGGSTKHQEKPHIVARLRRFFGNPNVRMIGMRDDFSADWIREKLEPAAPVTSEPDIVCSLELPPVSKPSGQPILGIVTRQRRVDTPDDYARLEELAEHAKRRGFRIRHIVLGTGSVGERDFANAPALNVENKEVVHSEDLTALTRAIGECTVLASMKFHGTVVATMYGVPSIVLVPTNKNRNFMARIGRSELVARHDSDKLIEIFGLRGPEPIDPEQVAMLRTRSTAFMEHLRDQLIAEVGLTSTPGHA